MIGFVRQRRAGYAALFLLLIFISRAVLLNRLEMNHDEIWHVWQTSGTLDETMRWLPYDWPPLYFVLLWGWQGLVGSHPVMMRALSVLLFMLASAWAFRLGKQLFGTDKAGWGLMLAYAALGYTIFLSTYVRAYVLMLLLLPMTLYFALRYLGKPSIWRALLLAMGMAALFYTNLTAVVAFAAIGLTTLIMYPRRIWHWWLPGVLAALLALPEILAKAELAGRRNAGLGDTLPPFIDGLVEIYKTHLGHAALVWLVVFIVLAVVLLLRRQMKWRLVLVIAGWLLIVPVLVYALDSVLGFFTPQYAWWVILGLAVLFAWGYSAVTLYGRAALAVFLIAVMLYPATQGERPFDSLSYGGIPTLPFEETLPVVADAMQNGDVILMDPACNCGELYAWDYYQSIYFPQVPQHITEPGDYRRIWYVYRPEQNDEAIQAALEETHVSGKFVGPWELFFRLYEAPPDVGGIAFENGLRFHGVQVMDADGQPQVEPLVYREGEAVHLRLWWSVDEPLNADYSVTLQILNADGLLAQDDGAPQPISLDVTQPAPPSQTSQWQPGQYYIEERTIMLPYPTNRAEYMLYLGIYNWQDGIRLEADGTNADTLLPLLPIAVMAW